MRYLQRRVFRGPSIHALYPVLRLTLDLGIFEELPTSCIPGFTDALLGRLPRLQRHGCSRGYPGGFVERLREGTWLGHVIEHVALALQNESGADVSFGRTRGAGAYAVYNLVFAFEEEETGIEAGELARWLVLDCIPEPIRREAGIHTADLKEALGGDAAAAIARFCRDAEDRRLGPSTRALVEAAEKRGIPCFRLDDRSTIQLGLGRFQQRIQATVTSRSSVIAVEAAQDKRQTWLLLDRLGLPVPRQRLARTEDEAALAAEDLGYPVVVKPLDGNHGRGVGLCLQDEATVRQAWKDASEACRNRSVLVEECIQGQDHRLLIVGGRMVAAARRLPARVVGDGEKTVAELVEEANRDPRRGESHERVLTRIRLDAPAERLLATMGLSRDSVPPAGEVVRLATVANLSQGGTAVDVTGEVHPDNRLAAERAALGLGLDVAGVDFILPDIRRSWMETGGAICEVNAAPGLRMHLAPAEGQPRDVASPILDLLLPPGAPFTIPITAITGTNGKTTTTRMIGSIHRAAGRRVGLSTTDGVYIGDRCIARGDMTGPSSTRMVVHDPTIDCAVLEIARGGLLRGGMGIGWCDVAVVTNVSGDHLGLDGVETVEDLAHVKRIIVETAREAAVLNLDCPAVAAMASHSRARRLCWFSLDPTHPALEAHIESGQPAVILDPEGMIVVIDRGRRRELLSTRQIPATLGGLARHNVQNALAAVGAAWCAGVRIEHIRQGLRSFRMDIETAPGRLNLYEGHPFRVLVDYAHNPAAFAAVCDLVRQMEIPGRRICVLTTPGDRRDEDIRQNARIVAPHFDHFLCRRDRNPRGRGEDEVPRLLRAALIEAGVDEASIEIVVSEAEANQAALEKARPGDLVVLFAEQIAETWEQLCCFRPYLPEPRAASAK